MSGKEGKANSNPNEEVVASFFTLPAACVTTLIGPSWLIIKNQEQKKSKLEQLGVILVWNAVRFGITEFIACQYEVGEMGLYAIATLFLLDTVGSGAYILMRKGKSRVEEIREKNQGYIRD